MIFISQSWQYDECYSSLGRWINEDSSLPRVNCYPLCTEFLSDKKARAYITDQLSQSQILILLGTLFYRHYKWVNHEIDEAQKMGKTIIAVKPWGQKHMPRSDVMAANVVVAWNSRSILNALKTR